MTQTEEKKTRYEERLKRRALKKEQEKRRIEALMAADKKARQEKADTEIKSALVSRFNPKAASKQGNTLGILIMMTFIFAPITFWCFTKIQNDNAAIKLSQAKQKYAALEAENAEYKSELEKEIYPADEIREYVKTKLGYEEYSENDVIHIPSEEKRVTVYPREEEDGGLFFFGSCIW